MEDDLDADKKREEMREKNKQEERSKLTRQQLEEKRVQEEQEINNMQVSEEEKERLLKEHAENMATYEENLKSEQSRSKDALAAKLAARRNKRAAAEKAKIEKAAVLEEDYESQRDVIKKMADEGSSTAATPLGGTGGGVSAAGQGTIRPFTLTGNAEQDWVNMLMVSPLFQQINDLQDMFEKTGGLGLGGDKVLG